MNICAICHEPGTKVVDGIYLCGHCNLTMQSGSRDSLMQTLELLHRLAKAEAALSKEQQRTWAADLYETQLADQQKRIADLEAMLGTVEVWYEIEVDLHTGKPSRSTHLTSGEAHSLFKALVRNYADNSTVRSIQVVTSRLEHVVEDSSRKV